ncbi:hypothetical protein MACK_001933 [Theileria orientalis]|uniref:DNA polymerase alpha subunit B n=1 Tax=Theileria orientalis TaxID=68886 RepID=A0A976QUZ1_THEOR|nr:hypothetical protein MACK_001933 [Theileria orientalis]
MGYNDDITINNIKEQLRSRLDGSFKWNLLSELLKRLESAGKNTKELVNINTWFKNELEALVDSKEDETVDPRIVVVAQSILDLIDMKSNYSLKTQDEIFIHTAKYVEDGVFKIMKGSEVSNKNEFSFDVCETLAYYKCNNATPTIVDDSINSKILRFSNLFTEFCRSKNFNCELRPLRNNSDTDVTVYGRIGSEGETPIDQLNVTLQGSTTLDMGLKVQVQNLHHMDELCLFPGQMAAVTGLFFEDNFGMKYVTSDIRCGIPVDKPVVTLVSQKKFADENLHIVAVKGALLTEDLQQRNFVNIFQKLKRDRPHVVFFTGPFVSVNQMAIEGYALSKLGDMTFLYTKFLADLANLAQLGPLRSTKFVIVPHCYDVLLGYPLPQPPLNCKSTWIHHKKYPDNMVFLSNPGYLRLNGILFGITSCDPLSGISRNMVCKPQSHSIRLICQQLLMQRSFFPSYPASKLPAEYAIDHTKLRELEFSSDMIPDVLLFCSSLKREPFVEFTNSRAFISLHSAGKSPKEDVVNSLTEIYITPKPQEEEQEGLIQDLDIGNRLTLSYTILKEE